MTTKAKGGAKRTPAQRERDLAIITQLHFQRFSQAEIAKQVKKITRAKYSITQQTVSNDIKEIEKRLSEATIEEANTARMEKLVELKVLKAENWRAWRRSQEDAETLTEESVKPKKDARRKPVPVKSTKQAKGQSGNPAFLRLILDCIREEKELLGLNAPIEIKGDFNIDSQDLSDDEAYERMVALFNAGATAKHTANSKN